MGRNPSYFQISGQMKNRPVEQVSYQDALDFIKKLNELDEVYEYRLPTEAEWAYAARGSSEGRFAFGDDQSKIDEYAWYSRNSGRMTREVGLKRPNTYGLYDVHGNVAEWVQGHYAGPSNPPPDESKCRIRGGSWAFAASQSMLDSVYMFSCEGSSTVGFRLVRSKR